MMPPDDKLPEIATVPFWALPLVQQVAEIRALAASIPKIEKEMDEMRYNIVPLSEHRKLMDRTDTLWDLSQTVMPAWRERMPRIDQLWDDRSRTQGSIRALKWVLVALGALQVLSLLVASLAQLGFSVHMP